MAGQIPSFLNGANMIIRIGEIKVAFAQSMSFSRNVSHTAVMGIGAYDVLALEPTGFAASGSMQILRWTDEMLKARAAHRATLPKNLEATTDQPTLIGNSIVDKSALNPAELLLSQSFDIELYERDPENKTEGTLIFVLRDCRISNYNFNFVPGELLIENVSFQCQRIEDRLAQPIELTT